MRDSASIDADLTQFVEYRCVLSDRDVHFVNFEVADVEGIS